VLFHVNPHGVIFLSFIFKGETVLLSDLVDWVTGLVDSEILHTKSVLFPREEKVADLRIWVENDGEFVGAAGARL